MKSLKDVKAELLANPAVRQAYDAQAPEFELARELIAERKRQAGLTQGMRRSTQLRPVDLNFAVIGQAVAQIQVDQALVGNPCVLCHAFEIDNNVF